MPTLFTKIINGEIPCHKIAEDEKHIAFLDIRPVCPGHTLVVPKKENDYIFDLKDEELGALFAFAKKVAARLDAAIECERVGVMVAGIEVPHTHVHLIPFRKITDLSFANAQEVSPEELTAVCRKITGEI